jgi:hypothetical protein
MRVNGLALRCYVNVKSQFAIRGAGFVSALFYRLLGPHASGVANSQAPMREA